MQWWCSAQTAAWTWSWQAYPGVWVFIVVLAIAYWAVRHKWEAGGGPKRDRWLRLASFIAALLCLWVAFDWPVGALGAGYLASAHMVQFLLISLVSPPLLLLAVPPRAFDSLAARSAVVKLLLILTNPLMALAFFNVALVATHWPSVVDGMMSSQWGSFALDMVWWAGGLVLWWPVVAPVPQRPRFNYMYKIGYLILATILNTPAFALLTFSDLPLYATFELAPPVSGMSSRVDQRLAGLLMKVGGGLIFWTAITVLFARWYMAEHEDGDAVA